MSHTWSGPTADLRAAHADRLWNAVVRHCGKQGVFLEIDHSGRNAEVYVLEKLRGDWYRRDIGKLTGETPYTVIFRIAHDFTTIDADLLALHVEFICRLADEVASESRNIVKGVDNALFDLEDLIASVGA